MWQDNYIPEPNSGCWIWLGNVCRQGYGTFYPYGRIGKAQRAHRMFYELHRGPIPDGLCACHRCDNRLCCNPDHIFIGTRKDNNLDRAAKGRNHDQRGAKGNNARLTVEQIIAIKASEKSQYVLAAEYGVSQPQISKIKNGKRW